MKKLILPIVLILGITMLLGFVSALENCSDSDDGTNYFSKGLVIPRAGDEQFYDSCKTSKILLEGTCDEQGGKVYEYVCPGACSDGACLKYEPSEETGPIDLPENIPEEDTSSVCSGCALDKKCYPYGFRKDGNFCSDKDSNFINQNKPEVSCENSLECDSNLCIDNKCVSGSLWAKFMRWFSRIFGGN